MLSATSIPHKSTVAQHKDDTLFPFHCLELHVAQKCTENSVLYFHGCSGYANAPRCYIIRTLPVLLPSLMITFNVLTPNDPYMGRTAPLTSKRYILYIYSTNIGTEYFKHALYSPFFSLQNAVFFILLTCLAPVLFTFYIQSVLKFKKNNSGAKGLICTYLLAIRKNTICTLM